MKFNKFSQKLQKKFVLYRIPKRLNFKRLHKGMLRGFEQNCIRSNLCYGSFGLKLLKPIKLTENQIKAIRESLIRKKLLTKGKATVLIRGQFNIPVTKKPNEIRMGKGKGKVNHWILRGKTGSVLFEITNVIKSAVKAHKIRKIIQANLGIPIQLVIIKNYYKNVRFMK